MQRPSTGDKVFHNLGPVHQPIQPPSSLPRSCHTTGTAYIANFPLVPEPSPHLDTLTLPPLPTHPSGFNLISLPPGGLH